MASILELNRKPKSPLAPKWFDLNLSTASTKTLTGSIKKWFPTNWNPTRISGHDELAKTQNSLR